MRIHIYLFNFFLKYDKNENLTYIEKSIKLMAQDETISGFNVIKQCFLEHQEDYFILQEIYT
jgi:hypothetical protein